MARRYFDFCSDDHCIAAIIFFSPFLSSSLSSFTLGRPSLSSYATVFPRKKSGRQVERRAAAEADALTHEAGKFLNSI